VGNYAITIHIDSVEGENQTSDNDMTAGTVTIIERESLPPLLSATSLYVLTLFIVGLSTFSALTLLRWKRNAYLALNRTTKEEQQSQQTPATTAATRERSYAKMISSTETMPEGKTTFFVDQNMQPINTEETTLKDDKFTEKLAQFRLHSLELIPLSARGIDISIQKIRILRESKADREQLELTELHKIVESQMELMENEIDQLKEHLQKLRAMSKNEVEDSALKTKGKEPAES
jgi:hypothetical protein